MIPCQDSCVEFKMISCRSFFHLLDVSAEDTTYWKSVLFLWHAARGDSSLPVQEYPIGLCRHWSCGFDHSGSVHFVSIPSICASLMLTYFRGAFDMLLHVYFAADTPISFHTATSLRARLCIEGVFHRDSNSQMTKEVQT